MKIYSHYQHNGKKRKREDKDKDRQIQCRVEPDIFVDIYLLFVDIVTFCPECSRQDIHVPLLYLLFH